MKKFIIVGSGRQGIAVAYDLLRDKNHFVTMVDVEPLCLEKALEKISKISRNDKLRRSIAKKGKAKYTKYFNSNLVADFIINKTFDINNKKKYLWHDK